MHDSKIRTEIIRKQCKKLQDAINAARLEEIAQKEGKGRDSKQNKTNPVFSFMRPAQNYRFRTPPSPNRESRYIPPMRREGVNMVQRFNGKCFNCGKMGHRAFECRSSRSTSFRNQPPQETRSFGNTSGIRNEENREDRSPSPSLSRSPSFESKPIRGRAPTPGPFGNRNRFNGSRGNQTGNNSQQSNNNSSSLLVETCSPLLPASDDIQEVILAAAEKQGSFVLGKVNELFVPQMLIDTGATITVCSEEFYQRLCDVNPTEILSDRKIGNTKCIAVNGSEFRISCKAVLRITIGSYMVHHIVRVSPDAVYPFILGHDFLNRNRCNLLFNEKLFVTPSGTVHLIQGPIKVGINMIACQRRT